MMKRFLLGLSVCVGITAGATEDWAKLCSKESLDHKNALFCAEERSPEVKKARLELERAKAQVPVARQWKNPELSANSVYGKAGGESASETDLSLSVPVELGGKIGARTTVAESAVAKAEAALFEARMKTRVGLLTKLHRMRQLLHEQEVVDEAVGTFSKLVAQYASRPKLSPEQEVTVSVFRMAKSEYDLKKAELNDERASLELFIQAQVGSSIGLKEKDLPDAPKQWPAVLPMKQPSLSPRMRSIEAEVRAAKAELSLAQSESWPTLTVGPSVKLQFEAGRSDQLFGFNISLPLPVFNANGAGKDAAASGLRVAQSNQILAASEEDRLRDECVRVYEQSVRILESTLSHREIERKHLDIESLFFKGVVPSSLVIEAHRTFVELEKSRNERELKAIEALLAIQIIDGDSSEGKR